MYSGYYDKTDWRETTGSDDSPINGEWVDLITYPEFANVKYERVMQEAVRFYYCFVLRLFDGFFTFFVWIKKDSLTDVRFLSLISLCFSATLFLSLSL